MSKPTKELVKALNRWKDYSQYADEPGDEECYKAIRSLIEKYGDGGPTVTMEQICQHHADMMETIPQFVPKRYVESDIDWLRSIGVQVGEDE